MNPTRFMGLTLKNPLIVAAGPWTRDHRTIQQAIDAGAGAVVTETITLEKSNQISPRIFEKNNELLNITFHSTLNFESWEEELRLINKDGCAVICSIRGSTPSELSYIATRLERWGADGLEISLFTPIGVKLESVLLEPDQLYEMVKTVTDTVEIPVSVLLPQYLAETKAFVRAAEKAGAKAITAIQTIKALWGVDIDKRKSLVPTFGGFSGPHIFPITLATTATLSQLLNHAEISAKGGIHEWRNIVECILLGASTVQIGSMVMMKGYDIISQMLDQLELWMSENHVQTLDDIKGEALASLSTFEELVPNRKIAMATKTDHFTPEEEERISASEQACMDHAITYQKKALVVDELRCSGCGLCESLSQGIIRMKNAF